MESSTETSDLGVWQIACAQFGTGCFFVEKWQFSGKINKGVWGRFESACYSSFLVGQPGGLGWEALFWVSRMIWGTTCMKTCMTYRSFSRGFLRGDVLDARENERSLGSFCLKGVLFYI